MAVNGQQAADVSQQWGSPQGDRIAFIRQARGAGVAEVAVACGMSADAYSELEDGLRDPSQDDIARVASALDVDAAGLNPWRMVMLDTTTLEIVVLPLRTSGGLPPTPGRGPAPVSLTDVQLARIRDLDSVPEAWEALDHPCELDAFRAWLDGQDRRGEPVVAGLMSRDRQGASSVGMGPSCSEVARDLDTRRALLAALLRSISA